MTRSKNWWIEVTEGKPWIVYSNRLLTRAEALARLTRSDPHLRVVGCEPYVQPRPTVWSGRNAYRDANPNWWERLYGRK
ncbi:Uncharacterised protein [Mycobacteroides abscessus subsp. abscessus]|nr:Uncharacterised protein [Mycobacteroides abscessus subsp. abscessus]SKY70371.1 Uncharacterised protein [Mycobacteroides abscessus subsp. abscessus]